MSLKEPDWIVKYVTKPLVTELFTTKIVVGEITSVTSLKNLVGKISGSLL